jgi:hypothetical protein
MHAAQEVAYYQWGFFFYASHIATWRSFWIFSNTYYRILNYKEMESGTRSFGICKTKVFCIPIGHCFQIFVMFSGQSSLKSLKKFAHP